MADPKDTRTAAPAAAITAPAAAPAAEPKREYRARYRIAGERSIARGETMRLSEAEAARLGDAVEPKR